MNTLEGRLRLYPGECLVGDWICAKTVPDWEWSAAKMGHSVKTKDGEMRFEIRPYVAEQRWVVWVRVR